MKGTGITLSNWVKEEPPAQINVTLHTKLEGMIKNAGRKKMAADLTSIKCIVIDEADVFFSDDKNFEVIKKIADFKDIKSRETGNKVQWLLFSATFPDDSENEQDKVFMNISKIIDEAK